MTVDLTPEECARLIILLTVEIETVAADRDAEANEGEAARRRAAGACGRCLQWQDPARLAPPMAEAQAEHYRNLADEARKKAKAAPTADFARQWTEIAKHYEMLAEFVAKPIRPKG
jgi:hypothetical protein